MQRHEAKQQYSALMDKLEKKRFKKDELKAAFVKECEERFRTVSRQQQLPLQAQLQVTPGCTAPLCREAQPTDMSCQGGCIVGRLT